MVAVVTMNEAWELKEQVREKYRKTELCMCMYTCMYVLGSARVG